jgi:hypothetical protein
VALCCTGCLGLFLFCKRFAKVVLPAPPAPNNKMRTALISADWPKITALKLAALL